MKFKQQSIHSYLIPVILGGLTGLIGALFQLSIIYFDSILAKKHTYTGEHELLVNISFVLLTIGMVFLAYCLVKWFAPNATGSGIPEIEGALLHKVSIVWYRLLPVKFIGGVLAMSSKMVLGREGPTVLMGGTLGEMLSKCFKVTPSYRDILIAAGAGAGLATAFNAPIAGILFVVEELRHSFHSSLMNLKAVAICCVMATIVRNILLGQDALIAIKMVELPHLSTLWIYLLLGLILGFFGIVFNQILIRSLDIGDKLSKNGRIIFVLMVGLLIGLSALFHLDWVGSGYEMISELLLNSSSLMGLFVLLFIRFSATVLCYNTGVPGGIFSPIIALGLLLGLIFFQLFQWIMVDFSVHSYLCAAVGMGGLFAAVARAPLTGIVLVVEITQNYSLGLPLMVTCLTSATFMQLTKSKSIYTLLLDRKLSKIGHNCE